MKKTLALVLVVCFVLSMAATALAFPVDFTGDFRLQGRSIDDGIAGGAADYKASWWQLRGRLNFEGKIDDSTKFFGRLSIRNDFGSGNTSQTEFDQYGVKIAADAWKFSLGRQAVNLGQGTIISTGNDAAGCDNKFDGLIATTKTGSFDLTFIGGKTNNGNSASVVTEWYGLDATTKINDTFSVGAAYARQKPQGVATGVNVWALNTAFNPNANLAFNAEYAKSNVTTNNKAFFVSGTYSWDKDNFTIQFNNVKNNAVDANNSGIGSSAYPFKGLDLDTGLTGYKGFTYVYNHPMTKAATLSIVYMDLKVDGHTGSDKELAGSVTWKF